MLTFIELLIGVVVIVGVARYIIEAAHEKRESVSR